MANDLQTAPEPTLTHLVSGIVSDTQELIKQQLALFREEVKQDLRKSRDASLVLVGGAIIAVLGGFLLSFSLVHLLAWAVPSLPLWGAFAIVGGTITVLGGALILAGVQQFRSFNPLPDQSVQALKENVQWITNPK